MQKEFLHILSINNFNDVNKRIENIEAALQDRNHKTSIIGDKIMVWTYEEDMKENTKELKIIKNNNEEKLDYMDFIYGMKKIVQMK